MTRACSVHQATGPNQVWSCDITWLPTTMRGAYLYVYLIMDVWSRRVVGWRVAERESADVAAALVTQPCIDGKVNPHGLVLHSDSGVPMKGSTMISTLQWLGVVPSFSRPHVSDDNPYSEALNYVLARRHELYQQARLADPERWSRSTRNWSPGKLGSR